MYNLLETASILALILKDFDFNRKHFRAGLDVSVLMMV